MFRSTFAAVVLVATVALTGVKAETTDLELCFEFEPAFEPETDADIAMFSSCIMDSYNIENISRGFKMESMEFVFADDDEEEGGRRSLGGKKKKSKKAKANAKNNGNCNGTGCKSEAENLGEESCAGGCRRRRELRHQFAEDSKFNFRGAVSRMLERVLESTPSKSDTELLIDDCIRFVNAQEGTLQLLAQQGVNFAPCSDE